MIEKPIFWDYITLDSEGVMNGIREDAPESVKKAYEEYLKEELRNKKKGIKV